ncbi:TrkH family potassium uptake protein [Candidatus Peregrinibacteria bacterium]|nr:TrkH family potassium uptake protein [Candidatus Peregrinibacteria bacterium]
MNLLLRYLGHLLIISAFFRFLPIGVALFYGESFFLFVLAFLISLGAGGFLVFKYRRKEEEPALTLAQGLVLVALSFIILPLIGALSFLPSLNYNLLDAYFESISGFTTTSLTLYSALDELPRSLLMWRAEIQWMGGVGIVMVFLFIFSRLHSHDYTRLGDTESKTQSTLALYQAQGFNVRLEGGVRKTLAHIMIIYFGYTLIGIGLLYLTGLTLFEATGMAFTALSTGGFSMTDSFYSSGWTFFVLILLMLAGSISFINHNDLLRRKWKAFFMSFEKNVFLIFVALAVLVSLTVYTDFMAVLFEIVSAFTTTGYSTSPIALLHPLFILMIMTGMMVGGSVASTSGGIKVFRIYYLLRAIPWSIKKISSPPSAVIPLQIHGDKNAESKLANIGVFVFLYVFILLIGTVCFMLFGHSFLNASFQVFSALGTVGLQTMDIAALNPFLKFILMMAMLFGRLEIFPVLIVLRGLFRLKKRI